MTPAKLANQNPPKLFRNTLVFSAGQYFTAELRRVVNSTTVRLSQVERRMLRAQVAEISRLVRQVR